MRPPPQPLRSLSPRRRRSLHPWSRRLRDAFGLSFGGGRARAQRVHLLTLGGLRCKHVVLSEGSAAAAAAEVLRRFADSGVVPRLLFAQGRELWVEYVEGETLRRGAPLAVAATDVAGVLGELNGRRPRRVPLRAVPFLEALARDLRLLARIGVLSARDAEALLERGRALAPAFVWIGDDCTDAILKNFVRGAAGRVCAVDLESLASDQLLGVGAAKAALRWLGPARGAFLERFAERGGAHVLEQLPFVELCFRAFWTRSSLLEGKPRFASPRNFVPFLETPGSHP